MHRVYKTRQQIWEARAFWYSDHFQKRQLAKAYPADITARALKACQQMPEPGLQITGALDTWNYNAQRAKPTMETLALCKEVLAQDVGNMFMLLVRWYWSEPHWNEFVQLFNNLPEPEPVYEITLTNGYPAFEVVPYMMGTTQRQLRDKVKVVPQKGSCPQ